MQLSSWAFKKKKAETNKNKKLFETTVAELSRE